MSGNDQKSGGPQGDVEPATPVLPNNVAEQVSQQESEMRNGNGQIADNEAVEPGQPMEDEPIEQLDGLSIAAGQGGGYAGVIPIIIVEEVPDEPSDVEDEAVSVEEPIVIIEECDEDIAMGPNDRLATFEEMMQEDEYAFSSPTSEKRRRVAAKNRPKPGDTDGNC